MPHPLLYEINTRCWLRELSEKSGHSDHAGQCSGAETRRLAEARLHAHLADGRLDDRPARARGGPEHPGPAPRIRSGPAGLARRGCRGSPYAIGDYQVPPALGGEAACGVPPEAPRARAEAGAGFRAQPSRPGSSVGGERPELFVQSPGRGPGHVRAANPRRLAGWRTAKTLTFAPWTDTVQAGLPARRHARGDDAAAAVHRRALRRRALRHGDAGAQRCVRQDLGAVPDRAATPPGSEFWASAIPAVKQTHPGFLFLAEVTGVWNATAGLGFDYTYDKTLYDGLVPATPRESSALAGMRAETVAASAHFLENHDEPRIASHSVAGGASGGGVADPGAAGNALPARRPARGRAPQDSGATGAPPRGTRQAEIASLYEQLLTRCRARPWGRGRRGAQPRAAWPENPTAQNFVIVQWQKQRAGVRSGGGESAPHRSQCYAPLSVRDLAAHNWSMRDLLGQECYKRSGDDLQNQGLYLDLPAHGAQLFHFEPTS